MGSLVDPSYELIDPTPDVHALFCQFDVRFFDGKLAACEVKWSPRMTTCAGICCYYPRSGLCSIRLSTPLLKLRPRKDLIETLLHEMIHAFLFITANYQDRDDHGPQFQRHMHRINAEAGVHISIYHEFHAEVALYKVHHWRCEGPCRNRHPYFGWVKRASNRAPSKNDLWWADHERDCGGQYIKVSEPKEYTEKKELAERKKAEGEERRRSGEAEKIAIEKKQPRIDAVFGGGGGGGTQLGSTQNQGGGARKRGGASTQGGGVKAAHAVDAKQPRIDAIFAGGRTSQGATNGNAVKTVAGGGGPMVKGGGARKKTPVAVDATQPRIDAIFGRGKASQGSTDGNAVKTVAAVGGPVLGGGAGRNRLLNLFGSTVANEKSTVEGEHRSDDEIAVID